MRSVFFILFFFTLRASASWSIIEDRKVTSFDMLTTRLGLIATNDAARVLGKWDNGTFLGVYIPNGEVNSIVIEDNDVAYASIKGDGIYQSSSGWSSWTKIADAVNSRIVTARGGQIFILKGSELWFRTGGSFVQSSGIPSSDSVRDVAIVSAQTSYALSATRLFRTNNGGKDWSVVIDTVRTGQTLYYDTTHHILYIGAKLPLRSLDNGNTFLPMTSIFFFSTSGAVFGTRDCSGTFYIGPDSAEHLEMYRSTSHGKYIQEVGSAIFLSYRYVKCVILDRGSTFFWLDKSGILSVSRDGCDGTIPDSVANYILFHSDSTIVNSVCAGASASSFSLKVRYDLCNKIILDSLVLTKPNPSFSFSFSPKTIADTEISIAGTFRAKNIGFDSVQLRLSYHSTITNLRESKDITVYAEGISDNAVLSIPQESIAFGRVRVDDLKKDTITLMNIGCDTLRIDSIQSSFPALFFIEQKNYPVFILPDKSVSVAVEFSPKSEGDFLESAALWTNLGRTFITLTGTGYLDPVVSVRTSPRRTALVFPNPTQGMLTITSRRDCKCVIVDVFGNHVFTTALSFGHNQLDLSQLPNGIYTIVMDGTLHKIAIRK